MSKLRRNQQQKQEWEEKPNDAPTPPDQTEAPVAKEKGRSREQLMRDIPEGKTFCPICSSDAKLQPATITKETNRDIFFKCDKCGYSNAYPKNG
mgnify:CR=1 FL=1